MYECVPGALTGGRVAKCVLWGLVWGLPGYLNFYSVYNYHKDPFSVVVVVVASFPFIRPANACPGGMTDCRRVSESDRLLCTNTAPSYGWER